MYVSLMLLLLSLSVHRHSESIGHISSGADDSFVIRTFRPCRDPMPLVNEIPIKLARKCLNVFGLANYEQPQQQIPVYSVNSPLFEGADIF